MIKKISRVKKFLNTKIPKIHLDSRIELDNEDARANYNILKSMTIALVVYMISWILNVFHIFIVDSDIMNRGLVGLFLFYIIIYSICRWIGFGNPKTKYFLTLFSVALWSFLIMILSYHVLMIILFPMICSLQYHNKKMLIFTYIMALIGITTATIYGFKFGLCDANMLLLTYGTTAQHIDMIREGNITLNQDLSKVFLYFVFPRWAIITAYIPILNALVRDIEERVKREAAVRRKAAIDEMTGVYNKNEYLSMIADYYPSIDRISVIFWDVNHLKKINDQYGHEYGDELIAAISESILPYQDETKKIYRIGGDEFVMIGENMEDGDVEGIISDWKKKIAGKVIKRTIQVSAAVGFAEGSGDELEEVIKRADEHMYYNKHKDRK